MHLSFEPLQLPDSHHHGVAQDQPPSPHHSHWADDEPPSSEFSGHPAGSARAQLIASAPHLNASTGLHQGRDALSSRGTSLSRKESRRAETMSYRALRDAHAKGLPAKYIITTSPEGEILTGKLKWMAAVRAAAARTLDFTIREFKKHTHHWKWALDRITEELDAQFEYTNPLRKDKLETYLGDALTNDRHRWKRHWVETSGGQHETCPDEAFVKLDKYWRSNEARIQSERMRALRSLVGKRSRSSGAPSSENCIDVTPFIMLIPT